MSTETQGILQAVYDPAVKALRTVGANILSGTEATVTVVNSIADTNLASFTLVGGRAKAGRRYVLRAAGDLLNNTAGAVTYTFRFKIGATTVLTTDALSLAQSAQRRKWWWESEIAVETTSAERVGGILIGSITTAATMPALATAMSAAGYGTAAENLAVDKAIVLSVQMGTAAALADCRLQFAELIELAA